MYSVKRLSFFLFLFSFTYLSPTPYTYAHAEKSHEAKKKIECVVANSHEKRRERDGEGHEDDDEGDEEHDDEDNCPHINIAPVASGQALLTDEDVRLVLVLSGTDANGNILTYSVITQPVNGVLSGTVPNLSYTPKPNFNGGDSFTFLVNDGALDSAVATISITVNAINDVPVANAQSVATTEDNPVSIVLTGTDIDGDTLSYLLASQPVNGVLSGTAPNLSYTPNLNFNGADSFVFLVNDGTTGSAAATVSIIVNAVNDAPVSENQSIVSNEDVPVFVTLSGTDIDGDVLAYSVVSQPSKGILSGTNSNLTYTPNANFNGTDVFTFVSNDGVVSSAAAAISITINPVNDAPVALAQAVVTDEDTAIDLVLSGVDVDSPVLNYSVVSQPLNGILRGIAPNLSYKPNADFNGNDSFSFVVNDGLVDSVVETISITINAINDTPISHSQSITTDEDNSTPIILAAIDVDGDNLSYAVVSPPLNGSISGMAPDLIYTPDANFNGSDSFTFVSNDGTIDSAVATISISVNNVNDAPIANNQTGVTDEDVSVTFLLSGDDIDGDVLSYVIVTQPANGVLSGVAPNMVYTPKANFNGTDNFTFLVNDGTINSTPATVSLIVSAVNDAPVSLTQTATTDEDVAAAITLSGTDIDGDALSFVVVSQPINGLLSGVAPNLNYTPNNNFNGSDSFTFKTNDGLLYSAIATVSIAISAVNDVPVSNNQFVTTDEDAGLAITLLGSDIDGDILAYTVVSQPSNGVLTGSAPSLNYQPNANFNGTDTFTFIVNDGTVNSVASIVSITVNAINDVPIANNQAATTNEDSALSITLTGTDIDGDVLSYSLTSQPTNGVLAGIAPNLSYTPNANFNGTETFTFQVNDGVVSSAAAQVSINITPVNDVPVAEPQSASVDENTSLNMTLLASDIDQDSLTFTLSGKPAQGIITGSAPNITYTPNQNFVGADTFSYVVSDGVLEAVLNVSIVVNSAITPLSFTSKPVLFGIVNEPYNYQPNVLGSENTQNQFSLTVQPTGMTIDASTGLVNWVPDQAGSYSVEITLVNGLNTITQAYNLRVLDPQASHQGQDFWLTFSKRPDPESGSYMLHVTSDQVTTGTIEIPSLNYNTAFNVQPGLATNIDLRALVSADLGILLASSTSIHVVSDQAISIYAMNYIYTGPDGFLVLPTDALGTEYVLSSYTMSRSGYASNSQVDIVAVNDNTQVQVQFYLPYMLENTSIESPPGIETVILNKGESIRYGRNEYAGGSNDFINTAIVTATKPVAVFSGHQCTGMPEGGYSACDHLVEQIPPADQLATKYAVVPFANRLKGDTFRVFTATDNTVVRINDVPIATINRGEYWENRLQDAAIISANKPIQVMQYENSNSFDNVSNTDPSMVLLVPEQQYLKSYNVTTPDTGFVLHYINLIVPQTGLSSLKLDGLTVDTSAFTQIHNSNLWGAQIEITAGQHHVQSNEAFAVTVYGQQYFGTYAYPGGMRLGRIPDSAVLSLTTRNSQVSLGETACLTATVTDQTIPVINARIDFTVLGSNVKTAYIFTNNAGQAEFCYQGLNTGIDDISATLRGRVQTVQVNWNWSQNGTGNNAPIIISTPELQAPTDKPYQYQLVAIDADANDTLSYALLTQSTGMNIDSTGLLTWIPDVNQIGVHAVVIQVSDSAGLTATQNYTINVSQSNRAPIILFKPDRIIGYVDYNVITPGLLIEDPDGDYYDVRNISEKYLFGLGKTPGATGSYTARIEDLGEQLQLFVVTDIEGNTTYFDVPVTVKVNNRPELALEPRTYGKVGSLYSSQIQFTDPDGDVLSYFSVSGARGLNIDSATGDLTWTPTESDIGQHSVTIKVADITGERYAVSYTYTLSIYAQDQPFELFVNTAPSVIAAGDPVTIALDVAGAINTVDYTVTVNGIAQTVVDSQVVFTDTANLGQYTVVATATDGVLIQEITTTFSVSDPNDILAPNVVIHTPTAGATITDLTDVMASIEDATLSRYELRLAPANTPEQYQVLSSGNTALINASAGSIDPTQLINGQYQLSLVATDAGGIQTTASHTIIIEGDLKVGNFTYTVEDFSTTMEGIPITIRRTYDSRRKHQRLDFGYGWSLSYQDSKIEESRKMGLDWQLVEYPAGIAGISTRWCIETRDAPVVTVTLPDGSVEKFEVASDPQCNRLTPLTEVNVKFNAVGDTQSTLELQVPEVLRLSNSDLISLYDGLPYDPDLYILTTRSGFKYYLDQKVGVQKIIDPNGNTITYSANGISHSNGSSILFQRDAQNNIRQITDINGLNHYYYYTAVGDLDRTADYYRRITGSYDYNYLHGLVLIRDALGRDIGRNIYDADGRMIAQEDNAGNRTDFNHDIAGRQSTVTDKRGNITFYYYDKEGNVTSVVDALGGISTYTYDVNGNQLSKTDENGNATTAIYNANNDQLTQTDALGNITTFTYNARGQELSIADAKGNVFTNTYDRVGNLLSITDPLGNISSNNINAQGLPSLVRNALGFESTYTYDDQGNKLTEKDALGHVTTRTYNVSNQISTETTERTVNGVLVSESRQYAYTNHDQLKFIQEADNTLSDRKTFDLMGNVASEEDKNGNTTTLEYDAYRRLILTTYADGTTESKDYDAEGNLITETDRNGNITSYQYDALNRQIQTTYADGSTSQTEYDSIGNVAAEIDERGNRTEFEYEAANRRTLTRDANGDTTLFSYDANDNLISQTDANGKITQFEYDALDRKTKTLFPDGSFTLSGFDAMGQLTIKTDQNGLVTQYAYDALGRLTSVTDALNQTTRYGYDEAGNKLTQTDVQGRITTWTYDVQGRVLTRTLPLGQQESNVYDSAGNVIEHTDFNGNSTRNTYNSNHQLERIQYAAAPQETFTYDNNGNRIGAVNQQGQSRSGVFDNRNRLITDIKANGDQLDYQYDTAGNRTQLSITIGTNAAQITDYTFDALNRLASVDDNGQITSYSYDKVGNRASITYPNGNVTSYVYDDLNRLIQQTTRDNNNANLTDFQYTLDASGKRTQITEINGRTTDYTYDDLYRLLSEVISDSINGNYSASYQYDAVGNRSYSTIDGVQTAYTYDDNDRLIQQGGTTYRYDNNGNTLSETLDALTTSYGYSTKNQLISRSDNSGISSSYVYDIDGIRSQRTDNGIVTDYVTDHNRDYAQVVKEISTDTASSVKVIDYLYGDDLIKQTRAANDSYYLYDGLGSTRALSDSVGNVTDSYDYEAFGETLNKTGITENAYLYAGEQYDANLDNYYLRARYYDQGVGRFTQMDTWMGNNFDPVTLNKYLYANVDPVNNIDPSGNFSIGSLSAAMNISSTLSSSALFNATIYTTVIIGTAAVVLDIADRSTNIIWVISESIAPKINSEADKNAYNQERRDYKNRCGETPPPNLSPCELWLWKLQRNKDCADMRESFGEKWFGDFDSGHQTAINDMRKAIAKLEKKISRFCK